MRMTPALRQTLLDGIRAETDGDPEGVAFYAKIVELLQEQVTTDGHELRPTTDMASVDGDVDADVDPDGAIVQTIEFFGVEHLAV